MFMLIYKKMYCRLFNRITDAIESETKELTDEILKKAQLETEEMYMESNDEDEDEDKNGFRTFSL